MPRVLAIAPYPHIRNAFSGIGLKSHRVKEIESIAEKESRMVSLRPDNVRIAAHALDKADAIHQAGAILVEGGYIHPGYIHSMMKREQVTPTYLGNGIAIPHGLPQDRQLIQYTGLSLLQLPDGVEWNPGEIVFLVLGIAARSDEHIDVLAKLTDVLEDEATVMRLARTRHVGEIIAALDPARSAETAPATAPDVMMGSGLRVDVEVTGDTGLHARPASVFVSLAKEFRSDIRVYHDGKTANGKSMVSMLRLGVERGGVITITADGPDSAKAIETLQNAVAGGLGEEEEAPETATPEPSTPVTLEVPDEPEPIHDIAAAPGITTAEVLDGTKSTVPPDPDAERLEQAQDAADSRQAEVLEGAYRPAITVDGHRVEVAANIGAVPEAGRTVEAGGEAVGLLRTEFLFQDRTEPADEDEQYEAYRTMAEALGGLPLIIRTLDAGGDKPLPYISMAHEDNPFLGQRGIRLSFAMPDLFRSQLRAILRAASHGEIKIVFPMIASVHEFRRARKIVEEIRREVDAPEVDVGIMVEVPSSAVMADMLAREVDFFLIGANNLTQYTLAMDRGHPALARETDGLHPAVLRMVDQTVRAAHGEGKWVGVCGNLASDPAAAAILIGLDVDELIIGIPNIPALKARIRDIAYEDAKELAKRALACDGAEEVRALTEEVA
jgi:phosphotransferase system HPr (HPr) family protein